MTVRLCFVVFTFLLYVASVRYCIVLVDFLTANRENRQFAPANEMKRLLLHGKRSL